ncbi:U4/U6 small nuclear ribonucleoprotein [Cryomyces antarcticus]
MAEKRPHPDDGFQNGDNKRSRSNNASPAPASNRATATRPDVQKQIAEAKARAEAVKARLAARYGGTGASPASSPSPAPAAQSAEEARNARLAEMRARVAAATARAAAPSQQRTASPVAPFQAVEPEDGLSRARGGLGIGLHPALMGDASQGVGVNGRAATQPRFATTMANRRTDAAKSVKDKSQQLDLSGPNLAELRENPYFDASLGGQTVTGRNRLAKQLVFHPRGKFIQQALALRRQTELEEMKKRIAEQARKVGLDEDNEKAFIVPAPPDIEWWDEGLVNGKDYNDLDQPGKMKIDAEDSIITELIQHPVQLEPPQEKNMLAPKPMYLTAKEQAKLRRQRRNADHKEQQAKIRLGLEPPPPPKVKKSNLMRVLGEQAVKDPTAVEARVNREIAERARAHEEANEERKLSKEARHEKLAEKQKMDVAKGVKICVFKVDNLSYGKHRYQIDINAKQQAVTGITILHPRMNLIIIEGGEHATNFYKKLMLHRIKWTENAGPQGVREGNREAEQAWLRSEDEQGNLKDLSANKCILVWEGEERARAFRKWGSRVCETDTEAKEALTRSKMENMWTLAKSME